MHQGSCWVAITNIFGGNSKNDVSPNVRIDEIWESRIRWSLLEWFMGFNEDNFRYHQIFLSNLNFFPFITLKLFIVIEMLDDDFGILNAAWLKLASNPSKFE